MKRIAIILTAAAFLAAAAEPERGMAPRIYIEPQGGLETFIAAAMVKKHVPAVATTKPEEATYLLKPVVQEKHESTGGKIARCLFVYCVGMNGTQIETVQLVNAKSGEIIWAYTVTKVNADAYQSTAEAVAKHLKQFLEKNPR